MRMPVLSLSAMLLLTTGPAVAGPPAGATDPAELERAWHRCLRDATGHQPTGQSRAGDERNALDECKARGLRCVALDEHGAEAPAEARR